MFARVHSAAEVKAGNKGSCHDLTRYLEKEEGQTFFSHCQNEVSGEEVVITIDNNKKGLGLNDAKFFMLSLNPSEAEQKHLIGREVSDFSELSLEEKKAVFEKLQAFTRSAMDSYALNFERENIKSGADLMYFAKIETQRIYKETDEAVRNGVAKIGEPKPGLNLHVHIIVSRKSLDGKTKLSPGVHSTGNTWELNGQTVKRGFNHEQWKVMIQDTFNKMFEYQSLKDETYLPKPTPEREAILNKVTSPHLKELLTTEQFTAANQIVAAMKEKGYKHQVRNGIHTFSGEETIIITHKELKAFETIVSGEQIKEITERFDLAAYENNPVHYYENGLKVKNINFSTLQPTDEAHPDKKTLKDVSYQVIYDEQTKTTLPLSTVKKYAYENKINLVKSELNKEVLLSKIKNSELRNLLQQEHFTAANQIVAAMRERGYEHSVKKGVHCFINATEERISIRHKDLNRFTEQVSEETMNQVVDRFNLFKFRREYESSGYNENDLLAKKIEFYTYVPGEIEPERKVLKFVQYDVIYDKQTRTTIPIALIRKYARENNINLYDRLKHTYAINNVALRECLQNGDLKTLREINNEMKRRGYTVVYNSKDKTYTYKKDNAIYSIARRDIVGFVGYKKETARDNDRDVSSRVVGTVGRKLENKMMNEILGDSFRTERMITRNVKTAVSVISHPANIKVMLMRKIASFLNPLKEM